ncbi:MULTISPECIES: iron-siderophore ABC transporter substrate-binding protein [unclassified Nodularia (in: cyanobacteria)]|uniref:ABC transporter substrate-binding protein n=1 Tax=unclassified Nodularia (in: cyanobacteria) TaxID=2656917 RepID=UPI0018817E1D|nr:MULTISPECIES: iron-siderophore ABC transporter substrate-binding protein [unclassified Nodularia (in: cyanobacteria)]MBE9198263.1 iron-siderophore ABC transporter substrate-binding protein [Nodularia sp. LEGE 06071]MCC2695163.1 iron-siderophore ABC transporter substrate-binding protein [Nodularia sp. LEGE 04288]
MTIRSGIRCLLLMVVIFGLITACNSYTVQNTVFPTEVASKDCRMVKHTMGKTCVPINPQRIVTFSLPTLGNVLTLGVKPLGSTYIDMLSENTYLKGKVDGIHSLGISSPNLEKILLLKPDIIIGWNAESPFYPLLSKIAPTVLFDFQADKNWRDLFDFVTQVLGKQEEAQQAWQHYIQRIAKLKTVLGERYRNQEISLVFLAPGVIFSEGKNSFPDFILKDVGLQRPKSQDVIVPYTQIYFSIEELEKVDGDILFVGTLTDDDQKFLEELKQKPLWKNLRAVQQNHVYSIDYLTWRAGNLLAADAVIDDLFKYLVNTP